MAEINQDFCMINHSAPVAQMVKGVKPGLAEEPKLVAFEPGDLSRRRLHTALAVASPDVQPFELPLKSVGLLSRRCGFDPRRAH
jgi:hypothetical protein